MPKPDAPNAPAPKRGTVLDYAALREAAAEAVAAARVTQAEAARLVAERVPDRPRAPSVSAISNAVREEGPKVAALQLDLVRALTGASFTGPLYRVD